MTTLATHPIDEPNLLDELALVSDPWTATGKPFADAFRDACEAEATAHEGWVNPNEVRARLLDHPSYSPRQLSALWSASCSRTGFLDKTDRWVPISGEGSRGNGGKSVRYRRWRDAP